MLMYSFPLEKNIYQSKLVQDFIVDSSKLESFMNQDSKKIDWEKAIENKIFDFNKRKTLVQQIKKQYAKSNISAPELVDSILDEKTFTVTTGHQLCLFGGPQYFIHKISSVIKLAHDLNSSFKEYQFLPIFWMASEDHDFDEIRKVNLFNKEISVLESSMGAVGEINPQVFSETLKELKEIFKNDERANSLTAIFDKAFSLPTWADATRFWVSELFKETPLIIVDGNDKLLKEAFVPIMHKEITEKFSNAQVQIKNTELKSLGYSVQVFSRPINLFSLANSKRERIVIDDSDFKVFNKVLNPNEILQEINDFPKKFSPNVILRPLYQEVILPNIAYLGGAAEVSYWLQLKGVFDSSEVQFPILLLRDSFGWIKRRDLDWWLAKGLTLDDFFVPFDKLVRKMITNTDEFDFEKENLLLKELKKLLVLKSNTDDGILKMLDAENKTWKKSLDKIQSKLIRAQKQKQETLYNRIEKIQKSIIDAGVLKERKDSFIPLYVHLKEDYIKKLIKNASPTNPSFKIIVYD
ncbi:MAG: bacillithiol biosynthesis cysteine-adding enzyme BshC [Flavobacteriales bacterium]|nr:bacillithiol biosynthesis cysteine-adding enzyme BshC [Flavobacteriales bacterium]